MQYSWYLLTNYFPNLGSCLTWKMKPKGSKKRFPTAVSSEWWSLLQAKCCSCGKILLRLTFDFLMNLFYIFVPEDWMNFFFWNTHNETGLSRLYMSHHLHVKNDSGFLKKNCWPKWHINSHIKISLLLWEDLAWISIWFLHASFLHFVPEDQKNLFF